MWVVLVLVFLVVTGGKQSQILQQPTKVELGLQFGVEFDNKVLNPIFFTFLYFPSLNVFVNISANFYSNIKFLYKQPTEWAVGICPQLYLRMIQKLRNQQKLIRTVCCSSSAGVLFCI